MGHRLSGTSYGLARLFGSELSDRLSSEDFRLKSCFVCTIIKSDYFLILTSTPSAVMAGVKLAIRIIYFVRRNIHKPNFLGGAVFWGRSSSLLEILQ